MTPLVLPSLLLTVPAPEIEPGCVEDQVLNLPTVKATDLWVAYKESVTGFIRSSHGSLDLEREVLPAVEFGLRLFNAENFSGALTPVEREEFAPVLRRFDPYFGSEEAASADGQPEDETFFFHTLPKNAYLQRLLLTSDGEMPSPCTKLPGLLLCLLAVVSCQMEDGSSIVSYDNIWRLRVHYRHQLVLKHRSHEVFCHIASCIDAILQKPEEKVTVSELLEVSYAQTYFHRRELAEKSVTRATSKSGLRVKESTLQGVRTRWQQHQLSQLILQAESARIAPQGEEEDAPRTIMGEHDGHDLLDRPRAMPDSTPLDCSPLHPEDKAILLLMCDHIRQYNPHHSYTVHRMTTYIERLLVDPAPSPFMIQSQILLTRSRLEMGRNRVQERSFMQITELVDQYGYQRDPARRTFHRTSSEFFYAVPFPSWWSLKTEYADFCFEQNLFKTALAMYEEVQDWEKIIECCQKLDKRKRAESLARELLARDPQNPMLWVALGEATRRDEHLWKAWELCQHRMAAPMRSLARLALDRERYGDVIEYFDKAVQVNPVFGGDWFSLGFACLKMQKWDRSGEAFTRVCQMNPDDAYAWNNLGSIMIRNHKKRPAFNAISQALRMNRRDWRMWQNYFNIGCELKEVMETTNALNICLTIAKRDLVLERSTLLLFVENSIAYLQGEIPGTSMDTEEDDVRNADGVRYVSMLENDNAMADPTHADVGEEEDTNIVPFGCDGTSFDALSSAPKTDDSNSVEIKRLIRLRHRYRCRALLLKIMNVFVNDPDIYLCAANLICFLDGPLAAYAYKIKELCVCHQKDLWEQNHLLFERTVEALQTTSELLLSALAIASEAFRNPSSGVQVPDPEATLGDDHLENVEKAALEPVPPEFTPGVHTIFSNSESYRKGVVTALKETLNNIKRSLAAAAPHLSDTAAYRQLDALMATVKRAFQEAKDEFEL